MKSLFQSAKNWISRKKSEEPAGTAVNVTAEVEAPTQPVNQVAPARPADLVEAAVIKAAVIAEAPELRLSTRGSKLYGTCPSCEATFNIRERLMRAKYRKLEGAVMDLSCPACDKPVGIPSRIDLRKLS